jgi:uncharacterized protein YqgC (DUF456 family)
VNASNDDRHPTAIAFQWASQITAIGLEIAAPVLIGKWLDDQWGTSYWTIIGAVIGPPIGFWHLLTLTGVIGGSDRTTGDGKDQHQ